MRILLLCHAFNSLSQRLFVELAGAGHDVSVELDVSQNTSIEAVRLFEPDLIVAPYLKRAIPEAIWGKVLTIVIHPGIPGDRGPSALDWALLEGERVWGVTALQANAEMDAGDIWASRSFEVRPASKGSLYRNEVTEAAVSLVEEVIQRMGDASFKPTPLAEFRDAHGRARPLMRQDSRRIDWERDTMDAALRKLRASDGSPGVLDTLLGEEVHLFGSKGETRLSGPPGTLLGQQGGAVCRACAEGAVWISHLKRRANSPGIKLPAASILGDRLRDVPEVEVGWDRAEGPWQDVGYEERGPVGYLRFDFYNGAMGTSNCRRLLEAFRTALRRPTRVIVLMGGEDFFSNGIDLNLIESAPSPADESMRNIEAIDDLCREILTTTTHLTVSALRGNAGAGGAFLAMAADRVYCRRGIVLNPHYKNMGNLYGSEYWTYVLPRRVGTAGVARVMERRLPMGASEAVACGLADEAFGDDLHSFGAELERRVLALASDAELPGLLARKWARRQKDEAEKPLERYRAEELEHMKRSFYGFDPSYHVARYNFVFRVPFSRTPLHLARHRRRSRISG